MRRATLTIIGERTILIKQELRRIECDIMRNERPLRGKVIVSVVILDKLCRVFRVVRVLTLSNAALSPAHCGGTLQHSQRAF